MDHLAIMTKSWGLIDKILSGQKKIESRWYLNKYPPWGKIKPSDTVYFKNSGQIVCLKATVKKVIQFQKLTPARVKNILLKFWPNIGLDSGKIEDFYDLFKDKKYCVLMFLSNPQKIKPFNIDKSGHGAMSSWIAVNNISELKSPNHPILGKRGT